LVASWRERSWIVGETIFPFLAMSAFVLVYRGLKAPRIYEAFVVLGGAMIAYWNNILWSMASQFFWEKEQGQLQLYLITPISRMAILLGMALGGIAMTTSRARRDPDGGNPRLRHSVPMGPRAPRVRALPPHARRGLQPRHDPEQPLPHVGREAWYTATLFQEPIHLASGFYFPVRALGTVAASLASILPIAVGLDGIRQVLYGEAAHGFLPLRWIPVVLVALLALFLFLAHRSLAFMENMGKREGRLTLRGD
jgi:ABC-2 type transport system permease protein